MSDFSKIALGRRIAALRRERGLSQEELAHTAGIGYNTVSRYEAGIIVPGAKNLWALADALDCTVDVLIGRVPLVTA